MANFEAFWTAYPRRIGKLAAARAYAKARKLATHEAIMTGVYEYRRLKPPYADWAHPTTWLNQGRWMDEYGPLSSTQPWECPHRPTCESRWRCHQRTEMDAQRAEEVQDWKAHQAGNS